MDRQTESTDRRMDGRTDGRTDGQKIWGALGARANDITNNKHETVEVRKKRDSIGALATETHRKH